MNPLTHISFILDQSCLLMNIILIMRILQSTTIITIMTPVSHQYAAPNTVFSPRPTYPIQSTQFVQEWQSTQFSQVEPRCAALTAVKGGEKYRLGNAQL
jgi:hypothetical protein